MRIITLLLLCLFPAFQKLHCLQLQCKRCEQSSLKLCSEGGVGFLASSVLKNPSLFGYSSTGLPSSPRNQSFSTAPLMLSIPLKYAINPVYSGFHEVAREIMPFRITTLQVQVTLLLSAPCMLSPQSLLNYCMLHQITILDGV